MIQFDYKNLEPGKVYNFEDGDFIQRVGQTFQFMTNKTAVFKRGNMCFGVHVDNLYNIKEVSE